jgi:hypothetical protein
VFVAMLGKALDHDVRHLTRPLNVTPGLVAFVSGYIAILFWFKGVDVYHRDFATAGVLVALYNVCRVIYIFYLFWIVYQAGNFLLTGLAKDSWKTLGGVDRIATGFFAGTGVWHAVLLLLGYLGLYTIPVAIAITLPLVAFAYHDAAAALSATRLSIAHWCTRRSLQDWAFGLIAMIALAAAAALLLVKGLYPTGGHDFFLHYFSYYKAVIDRGGLWPTAHYVHNYVSKGNGLSFLSMLLTDPLAPQLVSYCFIAAGALALYQLLSRIAAGTLWPLVAVILYLSLYIYTPGTGEYLANGGWGDFEKLHEYTTPLTIAILWLVTDCFDATGGIRLLKAIAAGSAVVAVVIVDYTFAIYLGLVFSLLGVVYLARRRWRDGWTCIALATTAGITLTAILAINYMTTGLFGDEGLVYWWRFTNVERLYHAGTLLQAIIDFWSRSSLVVNAVPLFSVGTIKLLALSLRLELLYPLVASGVVAALAALIIRRGSRLPQNQVIIFATALLAYLIVALVFGRNKFESISFYRYSSFTLPIMIVISVMLWSVARVFAGADLVRIALHVVAPLAVLAACWSAAFAAYPVGHFSPILFNAARFALGRSSIDRAYTDQSQWPGRLPWGGIYPGARGAYAVVGPHVRVWSFHIHAYCMLPDCEFEVFRYVTMTREDDRVFFSSPGEARGILQKAGLNYFLFSSELPLGDPVVAAPLFAPENIAKYLGLRWTDGTTSLLTWLGPDTTPLSQSWLATYCRAVMPFRQAYFYHDAKRIFADLDTRPHPWHSLDLSRESNQPDPSSTQPNEPQFTCPSFPIEIVSATYGQSCSTFSPKAPLENRVREGNVTNYVQKACNAKDKQCTFVVDNTRWGDPAPGCEKDFSVTYRCQSDEPPRTTTIAASAAGKTVELDCNPPPSDPSSGLDIHSATYGGNCGVAQGNATRDLALSCNGKTECTYSVDVRRLSDPTPGCGKDFVASYSCAPDATILRKDLPAEAGFGSVLSLSCAP